MFYVVQKTLPEVRGFIFSNAEETSRLLTYIHPLPSYLSAGRSLDLGPAAEPDLQPGRPPDLRPASEVAPAGDVVPAASDI